jgi:hypothetical protein
MPVNLPSPPLESLTALSDALGSGGFSTRSYLATADPPQRWVPQRVYTIFVQDLAGGKSVAESAREIGWRYVLPQAFGVAVSAEVRIDEAGRHLVGHFAQGPQSAQTLELTRQVVDDPRFAADEYTLQLLVVPALYVLALWLRHADPNRDWFVPVAPGDARLAAGEYYEAIRFNDVLMAMAAERMRQDTPEA